MSSCKRVIGRLDIKGSKLIKGIRFEGLRVVGDPFEAALTYVKNGIDEIFYSDAVASLYGRNGLVEILRSTTKEVFVPITAGGAIRSSEDGRKLLSAGADKLAINSGAVRNPDLINELSKKFGKQCVVISIQARQSNIHNKWDVMIESGREKSNKDLFEWISEVQDRGAGEILVTSVDMDGTGKGPDFDLLDKLNGLVKVPLIFGGGFGNLNEIQNAFKNMRNLSGISMGWALHNKKIDILSVKKDLIRLELPVRLTNEKYYKIEKIKQYLSASIIDYGMGNIQSLFNACESLGIGCQLTNEIEVVKQSNICFLPGVGSFPEGIKQLHKLNLKNHIKEYSLSGGRLIGICLGMQLLFEQGTEYEKCEGLGIIKGTIKKLPSFSKSGSRTILPHVGWNKIIPNKNSNYKFKENMKVIDQYFVHSFAAMFSEEINNNTIFKTEFEGYIFSSMIKKFNTVGMQFHPERSGKDGIELLKDVINSILN